MKGNLAEKSDSAKGGEVVEGKLDLLAIQER